MTMDRLEFLSQMTQQTITLMGISFIVGSLCTIFILLVLEMLRRSREEVIPQETDEELV